MTPFTIPDWLSLYRIVSAPFVAAIVFLGRRSWFTRLIAANLVTDAADGYIARRFNMQTERGARLDSIGDIITQGLMIAGLFRFQQQFLCEQRFLLRTIVSLFVLQVVMATIRYGRPSSFHTRTSKAAFVVLGFFYILLFSYDYLHWLWLLSAGLTIWSLLEDLVLTFLLPQPEQDVNGIWWWLMAHSD